MEIEFVRVKLKYAGGMAVLDLSPDDVGALVVLADRLRPFAAATGARGVENGEQPITIADLRKMAAIDQAIRRGMKDLWERQADESRVAEDTASEWQDGTWRKYDPAS